MVQPQNLPSDVDEFISVMQLTAEQLVLLEQIDPGVQGCVCVEGMQEYTGVCNDLWFVLMAFNPLVTHNVFSL